MEVFRFWKLMNCPTRAKCYLDSSNTEAQTNHDTAVLLEPGHQAVIATLQWDVRAIRARHLHTGACMWFSFTTECQTRREWRKTADNLCNTTSVSIWELKLSMVPYVICGSIDQWLPWRRDGGCVWLQSPRPSDTLSDWRAWGGRSRRSPARSTGPALCGPSHCSVAANINGSHHHIDWVSLMYFVWCGLYDRNNKCERAS